MEIKLGERVFEIPDSCPIDEAPRPSTLKRQLREHGVESFLTSHKLSKFAGCIAEEIQEAVTAESSPGPTPSSNSPTLAPDDDAGRSHSDPAD